MLKNRHLHLYRCVGFPVSPGTVVAQSLSTVLSLCTQSTPLSSVMPSTEPIDVQSGADKAVAKRVVTTVHVATSEFPNGIHYIILL